LFNLLQKTATDSILVELVDDQASTGALLTEKSYHNFAVLPDTPNPTGGSGNKAARWVWSEIE
jgi:hypothetical protein